MSTLERTQAKIIETRVKAQDDLDSARIKAERKIARAQANLARTEAKISVRIEKALEKADAQMKRADSDRYARRLSNATSRS